MVLTSVVLSSLAVLSSAAEPCHKDGTCPLAKDSALLQVKSATAKLEKSQQQNGVSAQVNATQEASCVQPGSRGRCENCLNSLQCGSGRFCCPYMKKCTHAGESCYFPISNCRPHCFAETKASIDAQCSCNPGWGYQWAGETCTRGSSPGGSNSNSNSNDNSNSCFFSDRKMGPLNMAGQGRSQESSAENCQTRCKNTPGCEYFSYWADGGCHITGGNGADTYYAQGVTAGPAECASTSDEEAPAPEGRCNWSSEMSRTYIPGCSKECLSSYSLEEAMRQCNEEPTCGGITKNHNEYTLRKGPGTRGSPHAHESSWVCEPQPAEGESGSGVEAATAMPDPQLLATGASGCPSGQEVSSQEECLWAIEALGYGLAGSPWVGNYNGIPAGCSFRQEAEGVTMHWNTASSGRGRNDLRPVCLSEPGSGGSNPGSGGSNPDEAGQNGNSNAGTSQPDAELLANGASGCSSGQQISSQEECRSAIEALGYGLAGSPWVGNYNMIPAGCSFRQEPEGVTMHWNTASSGRGRNDLRPVCLTASSTGSNSGGASNANSGTSQPGQIVQDANGCWPLSSTAQCGPGHGRCNNNGGKICHDCVLCIVGENRCHHTGPQNRNPQDQQWDAWGVNYACSN